MYDSEIGEYVDWYLETEDDYFDDVDDYIDSLENAEEIKEFTSELFEQIDWNLINEMQGE